MKTNLKLHATIIGIIFILLNISANAQSRQTMEVNIPFEFMIGGDTFEAGDYTLERFDQQQMSTMILKSAKGNMNKIFLANNVKAEKNVETPNLVFTKIDGSYFLSQIWADTTGNGLQLVRSKQERKTERLAEKKSENIMVGGKN